MQNIPDKEILELRGKILSSFFTFTQLFFKLRTGRDFRISCPISRESHLITISRALTKVSQGDIKRLIINIPPRYGKTELLMHFVAWTLARWPDSNFLYVSYSYSLAAKATRTIRDIITMPTYRKLFGVKLATSSTAKDDFETDVGGSVFAAGAGGSITGRGAGIRGCDRFGGTAIIDDIHKPDEVESDPMRNGVIDWYFNTMQSRLNDGNNTPIIFIGQKTHEADLFTKFQELGGWETISLAALDELKNALDPNLHTTEELLLMQEYEPYIFALQYQQMSVPAGGGAFKEKWFCLMDEEPEIFNTFITIDTAETDKTYNDPTVFSFFGVYRIKHAGIESEIYGLHWLDCMEVWIEPRDLQNEFMAFHRACMQHRIKPSFVAIEKKSTGVTLSSMLKEYQGLNIEDINRTKLSGSKATRYLEMQPFIAKKLISFTRTAKHTSKCIDHMKKITFNMSHRHDDIADTLYDAIKLAFIDKVIETRYTNSTNVEQKIVVDKLITQLKNIQELKGKRQW